MKPPLKFLKGTPEAFGVPGTPATVVDAAHRKICECDGDDVAQMITALPDLAEVCVALVNDPRTPGLREKAMLALAKFDGIGPFSPKQSQGTE